MESQSSIIGQKPDNTGKIQAKEDRIKRNQFKKGQSGNPSGRPKGAKNFDVIFEEAIKKIVKDRNLKESPELEIVMRGIAEARAGNFNFYRDILDRRYGKAKEFLELEGGIEHKDNRILDLLKDADKETRKKVIDSLIAMLRKRDA